MTGSLTRLGARVRASALRTADVAWLAARVLRLAWEERGGRGGLLFETIIRQVRFTGVDAFGLVAVAAVVLGVITTLQVEWFLRGLSQDGFAEKAAVFVLIRELPAILVGSILIARSGTAITTELASLRVHREAEPLAAYGIPLEYLLVFPRLIAFPLASFCLTAYFVAIALGAGAIAAPLLLPDPGAFSMLLVLQTAGPMDVFLPAVKSAVFGVATALVCSAAGLGVGRSPREIPQAATRAVSASFVACLALNAILSLVVLL